MAKFITESELNSEVEKAILNAKERLILISPYVKLHDRLKSALLDKKKEVELKIILVFGKNEGDALRSMSWEDVNFFKQFPNIEIRWEKRLHAKYYANETMAILTSMNLYSYSQDNNIEAGVLIKTSVFGNIANNILTNITDEDSFDKQTQKYFEKVIIQSTLYYQTVPTYESTMMGLKKKYTGSKVEIDRLSELFYGKQQSNNYTLNSYQQFQSQKGFCIRTGVEIEFNPQRPFCAEAYRSWAKFGNADYGEQYCHKTGRASYGRTSMNNPILK